jgi:ribosomal protein S18 acetylase RimI-like enzyme
MLATRFNIIDQEDLYIVQLDLNDVGKIQSLLEKCADYNEMLTGEPVEPEDGFELLADLPSGKTLEEKHVLGIFDCMNDLIGVLDFVENYPDEGEWYIGLLLLDPDKRNKGIGERVLRAFEDWARQSGVMAVRLGVVEQNDGAFRFWTRAGYEPVEKRPARWYGAREQVVYILRRDLISPIRIE